jgi:hypothetical protein
LLPWAFLIAVEDERRERCAQRHFDLQLALRL